MRLYPDKAFKLNNDIDLTQFITDNFSATGWEPICSSSTPFSGTFDGDGYTISGLTINGGANKGLFGAINGGTVQNLGLSGVNINCTASTDNNIGGLASALTNGVIKNCFVTGTVIGYNATGGIVGMVNSGGSVENLRRYRCIRRVDTTTFGVRYTGSEDLR